MKDHETESAKRAMEILLEMEERPDDAIIARDLDLWLKDSEDNRMAWEKAVETYYGLGEPALYGSDALIEEAYVEAPLDFSTFEPKRSSKKRRVLLFCSAMGLAASLSVFFLPSVLMSIRSDYQTKTAEIERVILPDGSTARLGPESALKVDYSDNTRDLILLAGEAYFEVAPNAERPFSVLAGDIQATAVGTAFNISLDGPSAQVSVTEGIVRVERQRQEKLLDAPRLVAGEWAAIAPDATFARGESEVNEMTDWFDGRILARNRPVYEIVEELGRHFEGRFRVSGAALKERRITGVYYTENPEQALESIAESLGAEISTMIPGIITLKAN
ncbi:MAG: FecR domain-containing protein [Verrucomicrobiota bacterium]